MVRTAEIIAICIAWCVIVTTVADVTCPSGWVASEGSASCFKLFLDKLSWDSARDACQTEGGDLVKIVNKTMNILVSEEIMLTGEIFFWIGLNDMDTEEYYVWLDESTETEYTSWESNQPIHGGSSFHCVVTAYFFENDYRDWGMYDCDEQTYYVCEIYSDNIPSDKSVMMCPSGWVASGGDSNSCFKVSRDRLSWDGARAACQAQDSDLVKVVNPDMNADIAEEIQLTGINSFWIGLNYQAASSVWTWLDEENKAEYTNWADDQPSDDSDKECVLTAWMSNVENEWGNQVCSEENGYVCGITTTSAEDTSSGFSTGAIAGIVLACVVILTLVSMAISYEVCKNIKNKSPPPNPGIELTL